MAKRNEVVCALSVFYSEWHWCEVDSHSRAGSILSVADAFRKTMDGLPVERKFIIVIIDTNLSESKIMFLQYLGDLRSNATTVIPIGNDKTQRKLIHLTPNLVTLFCRYDYHSTGLQAR